MDIFPPPPSDEPPQPMAIEPTPSRRRRWIWVGISLAAIAFVAGALVLLLPSSDDPPGAAGAPSASPSPSVEPLSPPENPEAKAAPFRVTLTWSDDEATFDNDGYEIRRNGTWVGDVDAGVMRFVDTHAIPGRSQTYEIRAQSFDGRYSEPVSIEVSTPLPPLAQARVAGTFDVRTEITSQYGYSDYGHPTFGWRLKPSCDTRACGFRLRDVVNDITMVFKRKGGAYTAPFTGKLNLVCGGTPVTSGGTVELRVRKAKMIGREWRATRLVGTMRHSEGAQLGCRASGATLALSGRLVQFG